jgi:prepilin-type N-terminal cleavage/methylation domain-containing protein
MRNKKRFTLIEIMIVVAIIALLALIALPNFIQARESARTTTCVANLRQIEGAKQTWAIETNQADDETPDADDLDPFITGSAAAISCPLQGDGLDDDYTINNLETMVTCNSGDDDHVIGGAAPAAQNP